MADLYRTVLRKSNRSLDRSMHVCAIRRWRTALEAARPIRLPAWLREGLSGEPTDSLLNKRSDERHVFLMLAHVHEETPGGGFGPAQTAKVFNVSPDGVGLICRKPIDLDRLLRISPPDDALAASDSVTARVKYCKQTIQGFKVGCAFIA